MTTIRTTITLTGGGKLDSTTSDYDTVQACVAVFQQAVGAPHGVVTWVDPDGSTRVINNRHIVDVTISEVRP